LIALPDILDGASQHSHLRWLAGWLAAVKTIHHAIPAWETPSSVSAFSTSGATSPLWCISAAPEDHTAHHVLHMVLQTRYLARAQGMQSRHWRRRRRHRRRRRRGFAP
jgi:hypothetical protein